MHSIAIREIIDGVEAMDLDPAARQQFRQLVRAIGAVHGFSWIEREERTVFYYNGHGVPKPTASGEIWVFNKSEHH